LARFVGELPVPRTEIMLCKTFCVIAALRCAAGLRSLGKEGSRSEKQAVAGPGDHALQARASGPATRLLSLVSVDQTTRGKPEKRSADKAAAGDDAATTNSSGDGAALAQEQCSTLTNVEGTHFTISVDIGTPAQRFDLVADTGSPWVIVEDCRCKAAGYCDPVNKCFNGNKSKTSHLSMNETSAYGATLYFGSGPIQVEISDDKVQLHGTDVNHYMDNGVLLMVDHMLNFAGQFEGILGLGMPMEVDTIPDTPEDRKGNASTYRDGFLTKSGFNSFTVCLSDDGNWDGDGAVHLGAKRAGQEAFEITSKTYHWQLPLNGAAAGGTPVKMCNTSNMTSGQESPCAAVFDSGTTYILGPENQILEIYSTLCEQWPRCKQLHADMEALQEKVDDIMKKGNLTNNSDLVDVQVQTHKSMLFQVLMSNCSEWYNESVGVTELPKLSFQVSSHNHTSKEQATLELDPWTYIVSELANETRTVYQDVPGLGNVPVGSEPTGNSVWTCTPAFGAMDMPTETNGPGWIMGVPLFYAYSVNYDMSTHIPTISFSQEGCDTCASGKKEGARNFRNAAAPHALRKVTGTPRLPKNAKRMSMS